MRIGVIGGGLMGSGIAEVSARAGLDVTMVEADETHVQLTQAAIEKSLNRGVEANKLTREQRDEANARITFSAKLEDLAECNAAIEAIIENEQAKIAVFQRLSEILPDPVFLASNTSSVPIMKLAAATTKPDRVLGLHFFNPVPVLPLVEVVRSIKTSDETLQQAYEFAEVTLGKKTIKSQDRAGFIVNTILVPYLISAIRMYEAGFASKEDIDNGMVLGCAHPMGPLALADFVGLDTLQAIAESLYDEYREPAMVSPALLNRKVEAGQLGRKSGQGFYEYKKH